MGPLAITLWLLNVTLDTVGQLAFKAAAGDPKAGYGVARWRYMAARPWLWIGIGSYVAEFLVWIAFLSLVDLSQGVLLGSIYVVNTFDAIYMMTQGGPGTATTNLPFYIYQRAFQGFDVGQAAALGVVTVVGTIIVATVALRLVFRSFIENEARA